MVGRGGARCRRGRPRFQRWISQVPVTNYFNPSSVPWRPVMRPLETVNIKIEEIEAMRLVDLEGLEQEDAAREMGTSRKTLWRDLKSGRKKVVDALINGKAIEIKGGSYSIVEKEINKKEMNKKCLDMDVEEDSGDQVSE
ncbi:MAG: DUF134 domain-containing protein [Methanocellales archaeon]|nr:DUF134 domain-containing protein [Methanocellales archaeon]MDD3291254.1 DUF134 domain-containing protein [Methanocellales archaeon]MDD5235426.1 DUF134 domain-containing protein [Methanocellales archaeon]MDD5484491.1 DUF134 domain-containing protein [Methanocellales archaeon]